MSCYFRHLNDIFAEAGIEVPEDRAERKRLDACIADLVGDADHHCPETWKRIKAQLADNETRAKFVDALRAIS
jgi:hypothetical protein